MFGFWSERPIPPEFQAALEGKAEIIGAGAADSAAFSEEAHKVHAIIASASTVFDEALMTRAPLLKVISRTGIGVDKISLAAATARGIAICNLPHIPTNSTAEHAIALMMAVTKHLKQAEFILHQDERPANYFNHHRGIELEGACLGVIGLGRIGTKVAEKARALGMRVVVYDPYLPEGDSGGHDIERKATLEALLQTADVVSLHVPSTAETRRLINAERLAQMKPGAYLINSARGDLVDEAALIEALENGHLNGAGLDVFDPEPPSRDNPLLHRRDVVATPHVAGITVSSRTRFWQEAIDQALDVLEGRQPRNLVNTDVWPHIVRG